MCRVGVGAALGWGAAGGDGLLFLENGKIFAENWPFTSLRVGSLLWCCHANFFFPRAPLNT
jgi:hypothetical protein